LDYLSMNDSEVNEANGRESITVRVLELF
jgi:hypothetical protein